MPTPPATTRAPVSTEKELALLVIKIFVAVTPGTVNGNAYTFNSTSTISAGYMNYVWRFGDGTVYDSIANPSHIYSSIGSY